MVGSFQYQQFFFTRDAGVQFVRFFDRHDLVAFAMNDQYRTSDLARGFDDIDSFQILKQRQIKPLPIVEGKAAVAPFLQLRPG